MDLKEKFQHHLLSKIIIILWEVLIMLIDYAKRRRPLVVQVHGPLIQISLMKKIFLLKFNRRRT
ncbi:hypothetical protein ILUMI_15936 [Ignelater luminosus]|uniref:Uncharacterized protein n=1 Tax=Ignelater luminosus TaxID=2038154 RepID=A0A8K0CRZ0_IGNLU|nr:hypothetical protein ILUMI_15936 [Ignelater luminosus]